MGVAHVHKNKASLYQIKVPSALESIERIMLITGLMQYILGLLPKPEVLVTEGAAYMASDGQVPLETARTAATIAVLQAGVWPAYVTPPKQVRLKVFGNGQYRAQEVWPDMPADAASALGCALYGYHLLREE